MFVDERFAGGELAVAQAAEEVAGARIVGAAEQIETAVAIEIGEERAGADATVNRYLGPQTACHQVAHRAEPRRTGAGQIAVDAELAAEITDDQVGDAVAIDVGHRRSGMAEPVARVDDLAVSLEADRLFKDGRVGGECGLQAAGDEQDCECGISGRLHGRPLLSR